MLSSPPSAVNAFQKWSTSSCDAQCTRNETASVNANSGPPFSAWNSWPSSSKSTIITLPGSPGPASPVRATFRTFDVPVPLGRPLNTFT
jgi:hypothetical protein